MASPRVSGARLDQLLQQAREPSFWLSAGLKFVWVNRAWEHLTGHAAAEVAGLTCGAHGPTRGGDLAGLGGSFYPPPEARAGRPAGAGTLVIHPSGERIWRRVEYWPFHDEGGALSAILGLVRHPDDPPLAPDSEAHRLRAELMGVRDRMLRRFGDDRLVGRGPAHRRLLAQVAAAGSNAAPVLLVGEPGTGKRAVARAVHQAGPRPQGPILPVDCAALPPDVLGRTLFGPGTGSGDGEGEAPRLALPDGATLVLGDVLDLPRDLQHRLASALDGPARVVATTGTDPDAAHRSERLHPDLYYALTALVVRLAPLRERLDELPLLAQHMLERANLRGGRQRSGFGDGALRALLAYDWPGNLRELARVVDEAHARGGGDAVEADDLPAAVRGEFAAAYNPPALPAPSASLDDLLTQVERRLIENALTRSRHNKSRAAEMLGISRPRLYRRIKELSLPDEPDPFEETPAPPGGVAGPA